MDSLASLCSVSCCCYCHGAVVAEQLDEMDPVTRNPGPTTPRVDFGNFHRCAMRVTILCTSSSSTWQRCLFSADLALSGMTFRWWTTRNYADPLGFKAMYETVTDKKTGETRLEKRPSSFRTSLHFAGELTLTPRCTPALWSSWPHLAIACKRLGAILITLLRSVVWCVCVCVCVCVCACACVRACVCVSNLHRAGAAARRRR